MDYLKMIKNSALEKMALGKSKTADSYATAYRSFERFLHNFLHCKSIPLQNIDSTLMQHYEHYLLQIKGISRNTCSAYIRPLRSVYNKAVRHELCLDRHPFCEVFTGNERTPKRAISKSAISKIMALDLSSLPKLRLSRDLFLFSFFTRGMAFIDIAKLTRKNIIGDRIVYYRSKTKQQLSIKIEGPIDILLKRYQSAEKNHLFPLFKDDCFNPQSYNHVLRLHNYHLKKIGKLLMFDISLSSYVARHTWATQAMYLNIPTKIISESLGHTKEETTIIYLASFNHKDLDEANKKVLRGFC